MSGSCQPYQPLPISTGNVGIDRCGNISVYAAPSVVQAPVEWGCWPIQAQLPWWPWCAGGGGPGWGGGYPGWGGGAPPWGYWWLWQFVQGGVDPGFSAPPWWGPGPPWPYAATGGGADPLAIMAGGAALANRLIGMRQGAQGRR